MLMLCFVQIFCIFLTVVFWRFDSSAQALQILSVRSVYSSNDQSIDPCSELAAAAVWQPTNNCVSCPSLSFLIQLYSSTSYYVNNVGHCMCRRWLAYLHCSSTITKAKIPLRRKVAYANHVTCHMTSL